jgi:hypothetical protein
MPLGELTPEKLAQLQNPEFRQQIARTLAAQFPAPQVDPAALTPQALMQNFQQAQSQQGQSPAPPIQAPPAAQPPNPLANIGNDIPNFGGFGAPNIIPQGGIR